MERSCQSRRTPRLRLATLARGRALVFALPLAVLACHSRSSAAALAGADGGQAPGAEAFGRAADDGGCFTAGPARCDPRTNAGCNTAAGQVCEIGQDATKRYLLECFPPPNDRKLGETCSRKSGPYCGAGLHCAVDRTCRHFCCSDADCTGHDRCIALPGGTFGSIGVCASGSLAVVPESPVAPPR